MSTKQVLPYIYDYGYSIRKQYRRDCFNATFGVKQRTCTACSGSGYYDDGHGRKCGSCKGSGKEFPRTQYVPYPRQK